MKVTHEMSERLVEELHLRGVQALGWNDAVSAALKAVVASLPEPTGTVLELTKRVTALQMRENAVRQWAAEKYAAWHHENGSLTAADWDDLRDALGMARIGP